VIVHCVSKQSNKSGCQGPHFARHIGRIADAETTQIRLADAIVEQAVALN
jgi:hypothetical protein